MALNSNLKTLYGCLFEKEKKIIGWGTGSVYAYYSSIFPIKIDYLIDNEKDKWGSTLDGHSICSPDGLLEENPENVLIVIYSSFSDSITKQIRAIGAFAIIPASIVFGYHEHQYFSWKRDSKIESPQVKGKKKSASKAIVIQGPLVKQSHLDTVKFYTHAFPKEAIILSTWENSDAPLLEEAEALVDTCVLNAPPETPGFQNRNFQLVSTYNGLQAAKQWDVQHILKTRTDVVTLADNLLEACDHLLGLFDNNAVCREHGLKQRIIIPETYTRKYMLYHPADLVMYGATEDLLTFWGAPQDDRTFSLSDDDWKTKNLYQISKDSGPAESYWGRCFCEKIGRFMKDTVQDSWEFFRDFFIVVDNSWFEIFWYKYPKIPSLHTQNTLYDCISHYFWQQLYFNNIDSVKESQKMDIQTTLWDDFYGACRTCNTF